MYVPQGTCHIMLPWGRTIDHVTSNHVTMRDSKHVVIYRRERYYSEELYGVLNVYRCYNWWHLFVCGSQLLGVRITAQSRYRSSPNTGRRSGVSHTILYNLLVTVYCLKDGFRMHSGLNALSSVKRR